MPSGDAQVETAPIAATSPIRRQMLDAAGIAPDLLPARWPGDDAAEFFDRHAGRLRPAADRFVEDCLTVVKGGLP